MDKEITLLAILCAVTLILLGAVCFSIKVDNRSMFDQQKIQLHGIQTLIKQNGQMINALNKEINYIRKEIKKQ